MLMWPNLPSGWPKQCEIQGSPRSSEGCSPTRGNPRQRVNLQNSPDLKTHHGGVNEPEEDTLESSVLVGHVEST